MKLVGRATSPGKRKDIVVTEICEKCTNDLPEVMRDVQHYLRGCFMKRIVREYGPEIVTLFPSGHINFDFHYPDQAYDLDTIRRVADPYFFRGDNIERYYNEVKKTIAVPLHVKMRGLEREWEKFKDFTTNIDGYIVVERLMGETSVLVQLYQLVREYLEAMPNTARPVLTEAGACICKDAEKVVEYVKQGRNFVFTYYGACVYSRHLVYHAILHNLNKAVEFYLKAKSAECIPLSTDHWRYFFQAYDFHDGNTVNSSIGYWELQIKGVRKWLKVANNQGARKYAALYFQEVIDEVKQVFDQESLASEYLVKMVTLNEIFKNTLDLENGEGDPEEAGSDDSKQVETRDEH